MENEQPAAVNTPSRLRPPRPRKEFSAVFSEAPDLAVAEAANGSMGETPAEEAWSSNQASIEKRASNQKRRLESPKSNRQRAVVLPGALPAAKPYKSVASATAKPAPVTKPMHRQPPKTAAVGKPKIPTLSYNPLDSIAAVTGQRPAWDRKGRLEEMEKMMEELKNRIDSSSQTSSSYQKDLSDAKISLKVLEDEKCHLLTRIASKEREIDDLNEIIRKQKASFETDSNDLRAERNAVVSKYQHEVDTLSLAKHNLEREMASLRTRLESTQRDYDTLQSVLSDKAALQLQYESQINALKVRCDELLAQCEAKTREIDQCRLLLAEKDRELSLASTKLREGEKLRRKLHNTVQELKGNIRVFCRVRPLLASEAASSRALEHIQISATENEQEEIKLIQGGENATGGSLSKTYPFTFDKVFGGSSTQEDVFDEISQLVQSALDGYRVCIFAYGQTGSGKTFTMEGNPSEPHKAGMIPRAVQQVFETTEELREKGWAFEFAVSFLEIYNETIRDLLASKQSNDGKYDIKHVDGRTHVTDLTVQQVDTALVIFSLLKRAAQNRAVAETQCNERSSRSHSVFTMNINGANSLTGEKIEGILHLIDLAGSERLGQSGSTGERLKETQAINKSLSSLGDVIHAISNKDSHIPFRNSKLTYLLQNSLGGNCKTLMFVNISPSVENLGESLCSLRFATKVNSCHIGTARRMNK